MRIIQNSHRMLALAALLAGVATTAGCSSIREHRGYVVDPLLYSAIHSGIDNQRSVRATLGQPTFTSQFGTPTWYYVSSTTSQQPFARPRISDELVMAITFDDQGNVASVDRTGMDKVVYLSPDNAMTPTLGRERSFLQDLFGNIGAVGAPGAAAPTGP